MSILYPSFIQMREYLVGMQHVLLQTCSIFALIYPLPICNCSNTSRCINWTVKITLKTLQRPFYRFTYAYTAAVRPHTCQFQLALLLRCLGIGSFDICWFWKMLENVKELYICTSMLTTWVSASFALFTTILYVKSSVIYSNLFV